MFGSEYFIVAAGTIDLHDPDIVAKVGDITFYSLTVRVIKTAMEDRAEDYGQTLRYEGGIIGSESEFMFDQRFTFPIGRDVAVPGNVVDAIQGSRYADAFSVSGGKEKHLGVFKTEQDASFQPIVITKNSCGC